MYRLQTMDIPYYCYDILLSLSLKGYVKGTNNLVNIKQNQSIRGTNKDFPNSPAEYANIDDFIMDYYELYVTGGKSVNESGNRDCSNVYDNDKIYLNSIICEIN